MRVADGRVAWHLGMGKYSPVIATDQHYYFTLNGILAAFRGRYSPAEQKVTTTAGGASSRRATAAKRR